MRQPDGTIKENVFYNWSSIPLDRDAAFAKGHFDINDNVRVNATANFARTNSETSLGLTADNITFWGVPIPFSNNTYTGSVVRGIPSSVNPDGTTNAAYLPGGRFGLNTCPATGGCTERQAWPVPPEIAALYATRAFPEAALWLSAPPFTVSVSPAAMLIAPVFVRLGVVPLWVIVRSPPLTSIVPLF